MNNSWKNNNLLKKIRENQEEEDIIEYLKRNNFEINPGEENKVIIALAKYAAKDSDFGKQQLGPQGKEVAKITAYLCKINPAFKKIMLNESTKNTREIRIKEGLFDNAKNTLLKTLKISHKDKSDSNSEKVKDSETNTNKSKTSLKNIKVDPFVKGRATTQDKNNIFYIITPFTSTVQFESEDGSLKGKLKCIIKCQTILKRYWQDNKSNSKKNLFFIKKNNWINNNLITECNGVLSEEIQKAISSSIMTKERIDQLRKQTEEDYRKNLKVYFQNMVAKEKANTKEKKETLINTGTMIRKDHSANIPTTPQRITNGIPSYK